MLIRPIDLHAQALYRALTAPKSDDPADDLPLVTQDELDEAHEAQRRREERGE